MSHAAMLTVMLCLGQTGPDNEAFFEARIRPVLSETCVRCHGSKKASNKLRLDSLEALLQGGERGPAVVPGHPEKSLLLTALHYTDADLRMPPGKKLPDHVVADFTTWIKRGAVWPKNQLVKDIPARHWAFQPVAKVAIPDDPTGQFDHPIDRFIQARLTQEGLVPVGSADPRTLLRRLSFDLVGLPPEKKLLDTFLKDPSKGAYARAVDKLLASPRYGERWGRHWMDVVRYADTAGDNADYPIPEIYRYRDYIIDSFNADKPFDQFVREQLAGDILAKQNKTKKFADQVVATGFLALSRRYATGPYEFWHLSLEDCIDTTGAAFLGLTMRCARCHDHKFDPISTEDYYGLYGIFASTVFPYAGSEEFASENEPRQHFVPLVRNPDVVLARYRKEVKTLKDRVEALADEEADPDDKDKKDSEELKALRKQFKKLQSFGIPANVPAAYAVQDGKPVEVKIQVKGDPAKLGAVAARRVPKFLETSTVQFPSDGSGRLQLAQWITRPDNPLTARVIVNRVWLYHFGQGLVGTPNNFGTRGEAPSHPELLDHLADEFVQHGWSIQWLHRYILQSKTYQRSSTPSAALLAKDPGNRWLGRFSRRQLDAEALRDAMLQVSGKLDLKRPGPHPFPQILDWTWTQHTPFKAVYPSNHRSVYLMTQRFQRHPFLALFDGPDPNTSTEKRTRSLVPLQALYLMNHPFVREQASALALRLMKHSNSPTHRVDKAIQLAWSRPATAKEKQAGADYVKNYIDLANSERSDRQDECCLELEAWTSYARVVLTANEFMFVD